MFKRIVFISIFQIGYGGGDGRVAHEMAAHFSDGYECVLMCPGSATGLTETAEGLKVFAVQSSGRGHFLIPLLTQRNIREIYAFLEAFQPDVIHAHDPTLLGVIVQVWARMSRVPFVYTAHEHPSKILDFGLKEMTKLPVDFLAGPITQSFLEDFYQNCDAVVALNSNAASGIRDFGYAGRLFIIPNGRDLRRYSACQPADISEPEKILTFVGFITLRKNQIYLLEMLKHLPKNYNLRLIGEPLDPGYKERLLDVVEASQLGNVEFTGEVRYEAIPAYYEASHLVVSASKMEVQSLVVIEALASGTPVVGLSNETVDELVDDSDGARLPKDTPPADFAQSVIRLCTLPQAQYDRLCQSARQRVRHLDWANVTQAAIEMYDALIREKAAASIAEPARPARPARHLALPPLMVPATRDLAARLSAANRSLAARLRPATRDLAARLSAANRSLAARLRPATRDLAARLSPATRSLAARLGSAGGGLAARVRRVRRVSRRTWLFAGLTAGVSMLAYMLWRGKPRGPRS